jgi:hypothetical protein
MLYGRDGISGDRLYCDLDVEDRLASTTIKKSKSSRTLDGVRM